MKGETEESVSHIWPRPCWLGKGETEKNQAKYETIVRNGTIHTLLKIKISMYEINMQS